MRFGYTGGNAIRLFWALLLVGATSAMLTTLALGMTPQQYPGLDLPRNSRDQLTLALALIAMWLVLGAPFLTPHVVGPRDVVLRQGVLFHSRIPYAEIEEVGYGAQLPIGLGMRWYPDALFVITWPANLVEIRLKRRHVFRLLGIIPLPPARTVTVNVDDPDRFLMALRERLSRS